MLGGKRLGWFTCRNFFFWNLKKKGGKGRLSFGVKKISGFAGGFFLDQFDFHHSLFSFSAYMVHSQKTSQTRERKRDIIPPPPSPPPKKVGYIVKLNTVLFDLKKALDFGGDRGVGLVVE